jgi:hypothetical protein
LTYNLLTVEALVYSHEIKIFLKNKKAAANYLMRLFIIGSPGL